VLLKSIDVMILLQSCRVKVYRCYDTISLVELVYRCYDTITVL